MQQETCPLQTGTTRSTRRERMNKKMIVLAVLFMCAGVLQAAPYVIDSTTATDDMYKVWNKPAYGMGWGMYIGDTCWVAMQFDLPHAEGESIEAVASATLRFRWHTIEAEEDRSIPFKMYRLTQTFDESNPPQLGDNEWLAHDASVYVEFDLQAAVVGEDFDVDVSSLLAGNGDAQTFGVIFICDETKAGELRLRSNQSSSSADRPRLVNVEYAVPEPGTMSLLVGGLAIALKRKNRN